MAMSGRYPEELRGLVEKRAVVLVAFDHELAPAAQAIAAAEVRRDPAHEHARVTPAGREQPRDEGGRRRLAVRPGHDNGASRPEEFVTHELGQRADSGSCARARPRAPGCLSRWRCRCRPIEIGRDVLRAIAVERADALVLEERAHRGIHVRVGTADVPAAVLQHHGHRGHGGSADSDEVNAIGHVRVAEATRQKLEIRPDPVWQKLKFGPTPPGGVTTRRLPR